MRVISRKRAISNRPAVTELNARTTVLHVTKKTLNDAKIIYNFDLSAKK